MIAWTRPFFRQCFLEVFIEDSIPPVTTLPNSVFATNATQIGPLHLTISEI